MKQYVFNEKEMDNIRYYLKYILLYEKPSDTCSREEKESYEICVSRLKDFFEME